MPIKAFGDDMAKIKKLQCSFDFKSERLQDLATGNEIKTIGAHGEDLVVRHGEGDASGARSPREFEVIQKDADVVDGVVPACLHGHLWSGVFS